MTAAATPARPASAIVGSLRPVLGFLFVLVALAVGWELLKWFAGDPWRYPSFLGTGIRIEHTPPFHLSQASDINLPHVWEVVGAFTAIDAAGKSGFESLVVAALFTLRGALVGFAVGATFGLALA